MSFVMQPITLPLPDKKQMAIQRLYNYFESICLVKQIRQDKKKI